jgi:hypothetical protein
MDMSTPVTLDHTIDSDAMEKRKISYPSRVFIAHSPSLYRLSCRPLPPLRHKFIKMCADKLMQERPNVEFMYFI